MSMKPPSQLSEVLAKLRERFAATSGNTMATFRQLADQLQRTPAATEVLDSLRRELHRVHGTAGSYGFHEASRLAAALEQVSLRWAAEPALDEARRGAIVRQFVRGLSGAIRSAPIAESPLARRLLLIGFDDVVALPLVTEGLHRGFFVERGMPEQLPQLLESGLPQVVVAPAGRPVVLPEGVPLVPADAASQPAQVLQLAESLAARMGLAGVTLLIVDEDPAVLDLVRSIVVGDGMTVENLPTASELDAALVAHRPALPLDAEVLHRKPVVGAELTRRIGRSLELHRQQQVARGLHPATGLLLHDRAFREFDELLRGASSCGTANAIALLRPLDPPDGIGGVARWHRECSRVAAALEAEGVQGALLESGAMLLHFPVAAPEAAPRLEGCARPAGADPPPWCAGVGGLREGGEPSTESLLRAAEKGWQAARDAGVPVRTGTDG